MRKFLWVAGLAVIFLLHVSFSPRTGSVTIVVTGLKSNRGAVLISLFDHEKYFPRQAAHAAGKGKLSIRNHAATVTFRGLPYGRYAAAILHDENDNLKMDYNFVGMPKEGYGFTNNAMATFGPPSFDQAAFSLDANERSATIKTNYFPLVSN